MMIVPNSRATGSILNFYHYFVQQINVLLLIHNNNYAGKHTLHCLWLTTLYHLSLCEDHRTTVLSSAVRLEIAKNKGVSKLHDILYLTSKFFSFCMIVVWVMISFQHYCLLVLCNHPEMPFKGNIKHLNMTLKAN